MKTVVFDSDVIEQEVKPREKLVRFREMLEGEVRDKISNGADLKACPCPACHSEQSRPAFDKFRLTYLRCRSCSTLYVSPRPSDKVLIDFYRHSDAWTFWREHILPETRDTRRNKIFYPRARWLLDVCDEYRPEAVRGAIAGYHSDLLIDELFKLEPGLFHLMVVNPIADLEFSAKEQKRVTIVQADSYEIQGDESLDIILAFDLLDRCADIDFFLDSAYKSLKPGGLLVAGTILTGFDVLVLWDRSENIYPPDRLNLFSTEGLTHMTRRYGFEMLELSTPGRFDVESVQRAVRSFPESQWPRFTRYLCENRDHEALREFQEFLQKFRLSSFGRMVLRKTGE